MHLHSIKLLLALELGKLTIHRSDIPVTETQTDTCTEMTHISKTHSETNTEKIFNTHIDRYRNDHEKNFTETVIEMILKTDTEMTWLPLFKFSPVRFIYLLAMAVSSFHPF